MAGQDESKTSTWADKASFAQRRLIGQLERSDLSEATRLAVILSACTDARRCRSAACPVCGLAFQAAAVSAVDKFIRVPASSIRNRMTMLTIVPSTGCIAPGDLSVEAFERIGTEITTALAGLGLPPAIIGLEASFNEDTTGRVEDHCCVHTHSIQLDWPSDAQEASLKDRFPRSPLVRNPVRCDRLDQRTAGKIYPFKFERVRRVTFIETSNPKRQPYRDSKRRNLRTSQAVSLAIVEHQLGFGRRLLIHGIDAGAFHRCVSACNFGSGAISVLIGS